MSIFDTGKPLDKITKVVPVFLTINNEYAPYAAVAINSLIKHTNKKRYYRIIILHDGLSFVNRLRLRSLVTKNCAIQFKKITRSLYLRAIIRHCSKRKGAGDYFSSAVYYYRAFIASLFPLYEKGIYIDSDTILMEDVGKLFDIKLGENAISAIVDPKIAAIPEFKVYVENTVGLPYGEYVNSGVILMDLKKLRKMKYLQTMVDLIEKYDSDLIAPDQDYLNVILHGKIQHLDPAWNAEPQEKIPEGTKLVHFNLMNKPWHYEGVPSEELFWEAAKGTGFYGDLKRQQAAFSDEDKKKDGAKVAALIKKGGKLAERKNQKTLLEKKQELELSGEK